ncbi:MAG: hypothetical protein Fues2KO_04370 [Fuerstiella sp.]
MDNAIKQITCAMIGTLMGMAIAGYVAAEWVDDKVEDVSQMIDQKIADVANAPARAASNAWEGVKNAAFSVWGE